MTGILDRAKARSQSVIVRLGYAILGPLPYFKSYREMFMQSGITITYEAYMAASFFTGIFVQIASLIVLVLLHRNVIGLAPLSSFLASLTLSSVIFGLTILLALAYPLYRRRVHRNRIDAQLPYSFGFIGVLASAGMTAERLFERAADVETNPFLMDLISRFVRNVKIFGMDTEKAFRDLIAHSPSATLARLLEGMRVAAKTSGDFKDILLFEARRLLSMKRDQLRKTLATLTVFGELYVALLVVGPIVFVIMLSTLSFLGGSGGLPLSSTDQMNLVVFLGIPVAGTVFLILLDSIIGKEV